jgi:hypothetical protein
MGILNHHMYCHICDHDDCICPSTATPVTDPKELKNYDKNGFYKRPPGRKSKRERFSDNLREKVYAVLFDSFKGE